MLVELFNTGIRIELNGQPRTIGFENLLPPTTRGQNVDFELLSGESISIACTDAQEARAVSNQIYNLMMSAA